MCTFATIKFFDHKTQIRKKRLKMAKNALVLVCPKTTGTIYWFVNNEHPLPLFYIFKKYSLLLVQKAKSVATIAVNGISLPNVKTCHTFTSVGIDIWYKGQPWCCNITLYHSCTVCRSVLQYYKTQETEDWSRNYRYRGQKLAQLKLFSHTSWRYLNLTAYSFFTYFLFHSKQIFTQKQMI